MEFEIQIWTFLFDVNIIAMWCDKLLLLIAFLIAIKEYKKLDEIINWTIIDLKVSGNYALLKRQVNSKRIFSKICTYLFIGTLLITEFAGTILHTLSLILRDKGTSGFGCLSLREKPQFMNSDITQFLL